MSEKKPDRQPPTARALGADWSSAAAAEQRRVAAKKAAKKAAKRARQRKAESDAEQWRGGRK